MKALESKLAAAAIRGKVAAHFAMKRAVESCKKFGIEESGMTTVEIVLLIAVAVVVVGLLSGYLQKAVQMVFGQLNDFISSGKNDVAAALPT